MADAPDLPTPIRRSAPGIPPCHCDVSTIDAMAEAMRQAAHGDPALLLRARVHISGHLARHPMSDAERRRLERQYADMLQAPQEKGDHHAL